MKLFDIMGTVIAANDEEYAITLFCEDCKLTLEEYREYEYSVEELPETYWNEEVCLLDRNGEIKLDEITVAYKKLFECLGSCERILSKDV
jgi:hypothetical protein